MAYINKFADMTSYESWKASLDNPAISYIANIDKFMFDGDTPVMIFIPIEDGTIGWRNNGIAKTIQYRKNHESWKDLTSRDDDSAKIPVSAGDWIYIKGNNASYGTEFYQNRFTSTCRFNVIGSIEALLGDNEMGEYCFAGLFAQSLILSSPELPATTLTKGCYRNMFSMCHYITTAPQLPATTLAPECYRGMFGYSGLTTAPVLNATVLAEKCYWAMFTDCNDLTTPPSLPAITLAKSCYNAMFNRCGSLTSAPELPATTLVESCYEQMFSQCNSLNYVKSYATDISASKCMNYWLSSVSNTGTFVKPSGTTYPTGASGIPSGWTIQNI